MEKQWIAAQHSRRDAIVRAAAAAFAATGALTPGVILAASAVTQSPGETEGPYWVDLGLNRADVRSDTATGAVQAGFSLHLGLNISKLTNGVAAPVAGAKVDIWHANALGVYSAVAAQNTTALNYLRGYQLTDANGNVAFETVYVGWYSGRTPHIHFRVRLYSGTTVTYNFVSQLYVDDAVSTEVYATAPYNARGARDKTNATDGIYAGPSQGNGGTVASQSGQYLLLKVGKKQAGRALGMFNVVL